MLNKIQALPNIDVH